MIGIDLSIRGVAIGATHLGPATPPPPRPTVTAMVMGQSELEYLFNTSDFHRQIAQPDDVGDGNLVVVTQNGALASPVRTVVNAASVAAGRVNPAMAAISAFLDHTAPGRLFVLGDGAVPGTSRYGLADDSSDGEDSRLWADFASVVDVIEAEFGPVGSLIECWHNSDAAYVGDMPTNFWPLYFGAKADGSPFELGGTVNGRQIDHCLYDASADPVEKGRGLFARADTAWHILTPMPFLDAPVAPAPELPNFSSGNPRLSEPVRANLRALGNNPLAQSVRAEVGPSAHLCRFGGSAQEIHPHVESPDGQVLLAWPVAIALLRASGMAIGEPAVAGIEGPPDGSYVDLLVDLPNGGELTTLAALRGTEYAGAAPHRQDVTGFEITRAGGQRRPIFRTDQADRPASHRGTVAIVDAGSGSPRRGRIRITPEAPFVFGDSISFLRGQATAALLEPRDFDLYPWFPIEHVPALFDASATYPMEGIAVRPYQEDLAVPVDAPTFDARGAYFGGASYFSQNGGASVPAGDRFLLSIWVRNGEASWGAGNRRLFDLRNAAGAQLLELSTANGSCSLRANNDTATDTINFRAPASTPLIAGQYYHVLIGGGPGGLLVFVNGVQVGSLTFATLDMAGQVLARIGIGSLVTGVSAWLGDIGHLYLNLADTLDLSDPANIAKFIKDGAPVDLGANGQLPTGNAPAFYYDGEPPAWANQGTAGNIPLTGALTASTSPPGGLTGV